MTRLVGCLVTLVAATAAGPLFAQDSTIDSRAEEIEAARRKKAADLHVEEKPALERALIYVKEEHVLEKWRYGWHGLKPRIGALVTGSGFAFGPEYLRDDLRGGNVTFRATTQFSFSLYQLYDMEVGLPKLAEGKAFVTANVTHRNLPRMQYYGPGPDSLKTGRSDYRLEDTWAGYTAGFRPIPQVRLGTMGKYLAVNVGPGTNEHWISTDRQFTEAQTPGIQHQSDFLQGGLFAEADTRDFPGGPRHGTFARAEWIYNKDVGIETGTHRRLNLEAQQYIPLFNSRRVIALRGRSELTWKNPNQQVPFYLQPVLGGSDDLRGFRPFRFYDDNLIVLNGEYRYEIFAGLDMALFADAGKVFHSKKNWDLTNLESSAGFGFRFNARNSVFMRVDVGFSHEGWQVWLKFNNVF